jgi:ATP-dependent Lon protease
MPKLVPEHLTSHLGFIADFIAEIFHNQLRPLNFTDSYEKYFSFGNHVGQRDRKAAARTISGLMKLIHPDGRCSGEEMGEYIQFALEMRRRVKEQLKRINPIEFSKVNLSYIDKETGDEFIAECKEIGATRLIPESPLPPGDIFTIGIDPTLDRVCLFRIQVAALPGSGRFQIVGLTSRTIKESARMAFDYLRANARKIGLDRDFGSYDFNIQVISPMHGKDASDIGIAFYIAILSSIINKPISGSMAVMGQMSIHGVLNRIEKLGDRLRIAMDSGAKHVLIPTSNAADFGSIPTELLDKLRVDFYSDPSQAVFKAITDI